MLEFDAQSSFWRVNYIKYLENIDEVSLEPNVVPIRMMVLHRRVNFGGLLVIADIQTMRAGSPSFESLMVGVTANDKLVQKFKFTEAIFSLEKLLKLDGQQKLGQILVQEVIR